MKVHRHLLMPGIFFALALIYPQPVAFAEEGLKAPPDALSVSEEAVINSDAAGKEEAVRLKELADELVRLDRVSEGADNYLKALSIYSGFTGEEKVQMAIHISWDDTRTKDALELLASILSDDPLNVKARVEYARLLSWQDQLDESLKEAEKALQLSPGDSDARLIKANSLNWKGKTTEAIEIYEELLKERENFEARLNLSYAYISAGERDKAKETVEGLTPVFVYQEEQATKVLKHIEKETSASVDTGYNYYSDSDEITYHRYYIRGKFFRRNLTIVPSYYRIYPREETAITGKTIRANAQNLSLNVFKKNSDILGTRGGVGYTHLGRSVNSGYFTGNLGFDYLTKNGWHLDGSVKRDVYVVTPTLIKNRIRYTHFSISASKDLTPRYSLSTSLYYRDISDGNTMAGLNVISTYHLLKDNPKLSIGNMFRVMHYRTQTGSGYFDPSDFISDHVFGRIFHEKDKFYTSLLLYTGYQRFTRNRVGSGDWYNGWVGLLGYNITDRTSVELNTEGGDYAIGSVSASGGGGFRYYIVGINLHHDF